MLKIVGNDVKRGGEKVGFLRGNDVHDVSGEKVGYFTSNDIYDGSGRKVGYIRGDDIFDANGDKVDDVSDNRRQVDGGAISDLARAAVRILLGD